MLVLPEQNSILKSPNKTSIPIVSLGLSLPFQPSIQDRESIQATLDYSRRVVYSKLKGNYDNAFIKSTLARLEKAFSKLNYNSNRKSVAIIIDQDQEKLIYPNFTVKPFIFFDKDISLLDLVANSYHKFKFYLLFLNEHHSVLFESYKDQVHKVYEPKLDNGFEDDSLTLIKRNLNTLNLLDPKNSKPLFITGNPQQVNAFYNNSDSQEIIFKRASVVSDYSDDNIKLLAKEINNKSEYWHSKFFAGKIRLAQKNNTLISNYENVAEALSQNKSGLLLLDQNFKNQFISPLKTNSFFNPGKRLNEQIEKLIAMGNQIEITEPGFLKDLGGIALIENKLNYVSTQRLQYASIRTSRNNGFLF